MTSEACATLYQTMVVPTLTYCGIVHLKKTRTEVDKSNALHERACRIISNNVRRTIRSPESTNKIQSSVNVSKEVFVITLEMTLK